MSMQIKVESDRMKAEMHVKDDAETDVRSFPRSTEGYGNPAFVTLTVRVGEYRDNNVQEITLYLTPDMAAQLGGKLSLAGVDALCEAEVVTQ